MKIKFLHLFIPALFFYCLNINGQNFDFKTLEAKIDAMIPNQINDTTPGLVIGIVQNGELIFSKGYGLANMAYNIPNDPMMVYNIGSVTKQFLGYAFAMLQVEGKLNIDDSVGKYLEDWPEFDHKVTLRNLLTHTSGYREAYTMSGLAGRTIGIDRLSREECLEVVRRQPQLEYTPGSRYTYNSTAWVILAEIFEKVTGESAADWVSENILKPLKMENTLIESEVGQVIQNAAESYAYDKDYGYINQKSNRAIFGAADIYTSVHDLVHWINNYKTAKIGGSEVKNLFLEPFVLNNGLNSEYALGIYKGKYRGLTRLRHTGGHEAFITQLSYYPAHDTGIIVISNFGGKGAISTSKIAELLLGKHMTSENDSSMNPITIEKEKLQQMEGLYLASTTNQTLNLKLSDSTLKLSGKKLIPIGANEFQMAGWNGGIVFEKSSDDHYKMTMLSNAKKVYERIETWEPSMERLKDFEGDYWSDELETIYHIKVKNNRLVIEHRWLEEQRLRPVTNDIFRANYFFVKFLRDESNNISGFGINSNRTLNVLFDRMK